MMGILSKSFCGHKYVLYCIILVCGIFYLFDCDRIGSSVFATLTLTTNFDLNICPAACGGEPLAGVPRGRSIHLAKGGVNTPPAERDLHKISDFVEFILGELKRGEASITKNLPPLPLPP